MAENREALQLDRNSATPANLSPGDWSGARDLNPGPHGREPARRRVLGCPVVSARVLPYSNCPSFVSSYGLPYPPVSANA